MVLTSLQSKLFMLALSISASEGERANAVNALARSIANDKKDPYDVLNTVNGEPIIVTKHAPAPEAKNDPFEEIMVPFGKHSGKKVKNADPDYLVWMSTLNNKRYDIFLSDLKQYVRRKGW
jgi:hypothetical protein